MIMLQTAKLNKVSIFANFPIGSGLSTPPPPPPPNPFFYKQKHIYDYTILFVKLFETLHKSLENMIEKRTWICIIRNFKIRISLEHTRWMELEDKEKVVASVWGAEFVQFLAALAVLPWSI